MWSKSEYTYRVRQVSHLVTNIDQCRLVEADGYFNSEANALKFAHTLKDGKNYVYIFDSCGRPVHILGRDTA